MSIVIELPQYLYQCPQPWRNMILELDTKHKSYDVTAEQINEEVNQYNGVYDIEKGVLTFGSRESYEFWRLKWS